MTANFDRSQVVVVAFSSARHLLAFEELLRGDIVAFVDDSDAVVGEGPGHLDLLSLGILGHLDSDQLVVTLHGDGAFHFTAIRGLVVKLLAQLEVDCHTLQGGGSLNLPIVT